METKKKIRRPRYTDDFRASVVIMLDAAGYPNVIGALTAVSKKVKVPGRTLSRWYRKEQNPPPDLIVREKRGEMVDRLEDIAHQLLTAMQADLEDAPLRETATAFGIVFDKRQLLTGGATENINQQQMIQYVKEQRSDNDKPAVSG